MNTEQLLLTIDEQLEILRGHKYYADILTYASVDNGIKVLTHSERERNVAKYNAYQGEVIKFVPASGAASRMFSHVKSLGSSNSILAENFIKNVEHMPFIDKLNEVCQKVYHCTAKELITAGRYNELESLILYPKGLNYSNIPKGLVPFHKYENEVRNAFMEQIMEALLYTANNGSCKIHFTVSPEYKKQIQKKLEEFMSDKKLSNVELSYSKQAPKTNTIAITKSHELLKDKEGNVVLRPGGHGALIHNLNAIDADLIFIKNIDNVVKEPEQEVHAYWKKILAGELLSTQEKIFSLLKTLDQKSSLNEAKELLSNTFLYEVSDLSTFQIKDLLNRPLRVCGMVKNEGKPGGGPFLVKHEHGASLQIVESAEINKGDESQFRALRKATHFNPVDIVCATKDLHGRKFDLLNYVNPNACFTSYKEYEGQEIKILELPGLWNGAMAKWNTQFIEVPIATFSPVKTVNDLAKKELHLS